MFRSTALRSDDYSASLEFSICRFADVLKSTMEAAGPGFSGIGLIVCDNPQGLPIYPLRSRQNPHFHEDTVDYLAEISQAAGDYHDGFHILSEGMEVTKIAQYFSPPISKKALITQRKPFGGRYLAALFGSCLPGVKLTGIATRGFGVATFSEGREIHFEGEL
ncbi:hypothetical protein [Methylobacterium sp. GXF4]|uniref:hypothetical protein n=1 Tax=Methylobacterium sp. GXF4 TaxID=1096546 RepID=UPI0013EFB1F8|nr:hypothetical protein [Methylobacterium sp. GXF4]